MRDRPRRDRRPRDGTDLVRWTRRHRRHDGAYYTGLVYPAEIRFPFEEVVRLHRRRGDPRRRTRSTARPAPAVVSCRAARHPGWAEHSDGPLRFADGPAAAAQFVGQHVGREPADQQSLCRVERVGLFLTDSVGFSSSVDVRRSIISDASDLVNLPLPDAGSADTRFVPNGSRRSQPSP